jgi:hypothetical protein
MTLTISPEDIKVSRISVPIDYYTPSSFQLNRLKKSFAEKGMKENKIESLISELKKADFSKFNAIGIEFLCRTLISNSAQKIYLVNLGNPIPDETISFIPKYFKTRIVWADKDKKIGKSVGEMLNPIAEDLEPIWEKIRKKKGLAPHHPEGHEHGYCVLYEFLTTMGVASKYETEADIDLEVVLNAVNRIKRQISSSQSKALIARIEGILNCYNLPTKIPCVFPKSKTVPNVLFKELMEDSKLISLSRSRYLLGIPGKLEMAMMEIKQKISNLFDQPKNRSRLKMAHKMGNIAAKPVGISIPEIQSETEKIYSSPLIALDQFKPKCLSTHRELLNTEIPKV